MEIFQALLPVGVLLLSIVIIVIVADGVEHTVEYWEDDKE